VSFLDAAIFAGLGVHYLYRSSDVLADADRAPVAIAAAIASGAYVQAILPLA